MTLLNRRQFLAGAAGLAALPPGNRFSLVDGHVHVWTHDPRYPFSPAARNVPARDATAEQLLALMDACGVSQTVIIQVIHYRWDNRYLADVLKRYPTRFRGVARVNPQDPAAPEHLSRLITAEGFHGVRLSPAAGPEGDWITGPLMPALWQRCLDLGVPMTLLIPAARLPQVEPLIDRFQPLTVVIDHMADAALSRPDELTHLLRLQRYPNVFVKVSHAWSLSSQPYPYADVLPQLHRLYDTFGPRRLIAGTDWPIMEKYCTYREAITLVRDHVPFLTEEDKRWICGRTAQRVWRFG